MGGGGGTDGGGGTEGGGGGGGERDAEDLGGETALGTGLSSTAYSGSYCVGWKIIEGLRTIVV